jgi:ribonuclease D
MKARDADPLRRGIADGRRFSHRNKSHAEAHAESHDDAASSFTHPMVCPDRAQLIETQKDLLDLVAHLRQAKTFAFDSEFIGELTYIPKLCLIQAATTTRIGLIDTLSKLDLTPFWELVADPTIETITHAGQQDVEPVFRAIDKPPANLFDTQICAGFIGLGYPLSLSRLVNAVLGVKLRKGLTFTHWDRRPLSDQQMRYAADDVRYLPAVRQRIGELLAELGHERWAAEESASLADRSLHVFDPEDSYLKIRGSGLLAPRNLAVLRELTIWRDAVAQQEDVPPRTLCRDETLLDMARQPVESIANLSRVRGLPRHIESELGEQIVAATKRAMELPLDQCPAIRAYEPAPAEKFRADALHYVMQSLSAGRQIDPSLIASRQEIGDLCRTAAAGKPDGEHRLLRGWRREAVGEKILALLAGQSELSVRWADGTMQSEVDSLE